MTALEEHFGSPECVVTTGVGTLICAYSCYMGIRAAQVFFDNNFGFLRRNINMDMLSFLTSPVNSINKNYNTLNDFYTLFKAYMNKKSLGISENQRLMYFIDDKFSFLSTKKAVVKSYFSSYELSTAAEKLFPAISPKHVKASLAIVPFSSPVEIGEESYISTQCVQGVASRIAAGDDTKHICLDTVGKRGTFMSLTSFQVMVSANEMMMLELKRRELDKFDLTIDLREHFKEDEGSFSGLYREGYQRAGEYLKKLDFKTTGEVF